MPKRPKEWPDPPTQVEYILNGKILNTLEEFAAYCRRLHGKTLLSTVVLIAVDGEAIAIGEMILMPSYNPNEKE